MWEEVLQFVNNKCTIWFLLIDKVCLISKGIVIQNFKLGNPNGDYKYRGLHMGCASHEWLDFSLSVLFYDSEI